MCSGLEQASSLSSVAEATQLDPQEEAEARVGQSCPNPHSHLLVAVLPLTGLFYVRGAQFPSPANLELSSLMNCINSFTI